MSNSAAFQWCLRNPAASIFNDSISQFFTSSQGVNGEFTSVLHACNWTFIHGLIHELSVTWLQPDYKGGCRKHMGARDRLLHAPSSRQSFLLVHPFLLCSLVKVDLSAKHTRRNEVWLIENISVLLSKWQHLDNTIWSQAGGEYFVGLWNCFTCRAFSNKKAISFLIIFALWYLNSGIWEEHWRNLSWHFHIVATKLLSCWSLISFFGYFV